MRVVAVIEDMKDQGPEVFFARIPGLNDVTAWGADRQQALDRLKENLADRLQRSPEIPSVPGNTQVEVTEFTLPTILKAVVLPVDSMKDLPKPKGFFVAGVIGGEAMGGSPQEAVDQLKFSLRTGQAQQELPMVPAESIVEIEL